MAFVATPTNFFRPTNITGCTLWLDAADPTTISLSGLNVSTWADKSGFGNNATAVGIITNTNNRMVWNTALGTRFQGNMINTNTTGSLFMAMSVTGNNQNRWFFSASPNNTTVTYGSVTAFNIAMQTGGTNFRAYRNNGNLSFGNYSNTNTLFFYANIFDGASNTTFTNGTSGTPVASSGSFNIGYYEVGSSIAEENLISFDGTVGEVIYYTTGLTTSQRQQVEGYLAWKWGLQGNLPSDHPYKNTPLYSSYPFPAVISPSINTITPIKYGTNSTVFNPTSVSGLRYWYDASDPTVVTSSGTNLLSIRNKGSLTQNSLNSNQNIATTGSFKVNGLNVVRLPANTRLLYTGDYTLGNPRTHIIVSRPLINNTTTDVNFLWQSVGFNADDYFGVNTKIIELAQGYAVYIETTAVVPNLSNVPALFGVVLSSSNIASVNGSNLPLLTNAPPAYNSSNNAPFYVNANTGSAQDFCEFLSWNRALSLSEFQQVEGYLAWKWGLTSSLSNGHPYKSPPLAPFSYAVRQTGQSIWSPLNLSGCALWLDAADTSSITFSSGTNVSLWNDKSGNGRNATNAGTGNPTYATNIINSKPAIQFNLDNYLQTPSFTMNSITRTSFVIYRHTSNTFPANSQYYNLYFLIGSSGNSFQFAAFRENANPYKWLHGLAITSVGYFPEATTPYYTGNTQPQNPNFLLVAQRSTSNTGYVGVNGSNLSLNFTNNTSLFPQTEALQVGKTTTNAGSGNVAGHHLAEIIVYNSALSTAQRQQVEGYLAWKWGLQSSLPSNHPYKNIPPSP
jgi:hypothetical protein